MGPMKNQGMEVEWNVQTEMETQPLSYRSPSKTCVLLAFLFLYVLELCPPPAFDHLFC